MPVTLTDQQAAQVRALIEEGNQAKAALKGAQELWNDPKTGDRAKALWKEKWPDATIDGYDQKQQVQAVVSKFEQDREKEKKDAEDRAWREKRQQQREAVQKKRGYTDDAMQRLEGVMQEREIYDYEAGDLLFAAQNPRPSDGSADYDRHFWNHDKQPAFKEIAADPEKWAFNEITRAVRADQEQRNKF